MEIGMIRPSFKRGHMLTDASAAIARNLKERRVLLGLSLQDVATRASTAKAHVWEIEDGRAANPTLRTIWNLADALEMHPEELLGLSGVDWRAALEALVEAMGDEVSSKNAHEEWNRARLLLLRNPASVGRNAKRQDPVERLGMAIEEAERLTRELEEDRR